MATANLLQTSVSGGTQNALALQGDGVFFPKASTASRLALTLTTTDKGFVVYDTTDSNIYFWNGTAWESIPGSGDAGANGSVQYNDNGIVSGASNFIYNKVTARVGIATATPADFLEVVGNGATGVRVSRAGLPTQFATLSAGATGPTLDASAALGSLSFGLAGSTAMTLDSTGLGIGIVASNSKLSVYGTGDQIDEGPATLSVGNTAVGGMRIYAGVNNTNEYVYIGSVRSGVGYRLLVLQPNGGNVGVGTALFGGSISNTARILAGIFSTLIGSTAFIATATPTTIFAAPSESTLMVTAYITGSSAPLNYNAVSIVKVSSGTAAITAISTALNLTITLSGANVQVTQTSGVNQTVQFNVLRLA